MIKVEHISRQFGDFCLQDINFIIPKGYIGGLIGVNGAGKTSLLHLLLGLYRAEEGNIKMNDYDVCTDEILAKNSIGYVMAEELFDDYQTLLGNADTYGKYYSDYDRELFISYCQRFELNCQKKLKAHSKGEKLKFQFAFALSHRPAILLLDEPTANFDPDFRTEFFKILTDFIKDGNHSVLLATHLTSDLDRIADYIIFMHKGKLLFSAERETLVNSYRIVAGEDYKLNLLPKSRIIYKEMAEYGSKALVHHRRHHVYDKEVTVTIPTIEDIMYYYIKEDSHV